MPDAYPDLKPSVYVRPIEAARLLSCSLPTIFRRVRDGSLRSAKFGHARLIDRAHIEQLIPERA